ncbi:MAG: DUF6048 family protein [Prevotella sp.]
MTRIRKISTYISRLTFSIMMLVAATQANAQGKIFALQKDSVPLFRGFSVSVDLAGALVKALGDYGEYEAALRINLHDQYFPIVEIGYGQADHNDEVTLISYATKAPYMRVGCDLNLLKDKHAPNRIYGGLRYAFTSYKVDMSRPMTEDPVWGSPTSFEIIGESCNQHWAEVVLGIDAKIVGPLHLGWNIRYKRRLSHKDCSAGKTWYIPGYGKWGDTRIGANFNVIIDI